MAPEAAPGLASWTKVTPLFCTGGFSGLWGWTQSESMYNKVMDWKEILGVIGGVAAIFFGVMHYFKWGMDAKIKAIMAEFKIIRSELKGSHNLLKQGQDNQKELLTAKVEPIDKNLNNHVTTTDKKIDKIDQKLDKIIDHLINKKD